MAKNGRSVIVGGGGLVSESNRAGTFMELGGEMVLLERWLGGERWGRVMVLGGILGDCGEQEGGGKRQIITAHIVRRSHPLPFFCRDS